MKNEAGAGKLNELTDEELEQVTGGHELKDFSEGDWVGTSEIIRYIGDDNKIKYAYQVTEVDGMYLIVQEYYTKDASVSGHKTGERCKVKAGMCRHATKPYWF